MNEDLKNNLYKRLVNQAAPNEKKAIKETICILLAKECANCFKDIYFYSSDMANEGADDFQLEYNVEYSNGDFQYGSCVIATEEALEAFGFNSYHDLKKYLSDKYIDKDDAWRAIVQEMKDKGLEQFVDEGEGDDDIMTNF